MQKDLENFVTVCESDSIVKALLLKQISRSLVGKKKYGVTLDRNDLNIIQWLTHLQEELMDASVYCGKLIKLLEETEIATKKV